MRKIMSLKDCFVERIIDPDKIGFVLKIHKKLLTWDLKVDRACN